MSVSFNNNQDDSTSDLEINEEMSDLNMKTPQYHVQEYDEMVKQTNSASSISESTEDLIVYIEIQGGYTFRQLIEFNKKAVSEFPIFCGKNAITTSRGNDKKTLVTQSVFKPENLTKYYINLDLVNNQNKSDRNLNYHTIFMDLKEFHSIIKNLGKKEGVRIFQYANKPTVTFLQPFGGKAENDWISVLNKKYDHLSYNIQEPNPRTSENPNITIPLGSFCSGVNTISKLKFPYVTLRCFEKGLHLFTGNETGSTTKSVPWGDVTPIYSSDNKNNKPINCFDINVDQTDLNALTKLSNFHQEGVVRIYCSMDNLIRLEVPLGCYAMVYIYLINPLDK